MDSATRAETRKTTRLDVRIRPDANAVIEQAADIPGVSTTDFACATLVAEAQSVLNRHRRTVLGNEERDKFLSALDSDDQPSDALTQAARAYDLRRKS